MQASLPVVPRRGHDGKVVIPRKCLADAAKWMTSTAVNYAADFLRSDISQDESPNYTQTDVGHSGFGENGGEDIAVEGVWYAGIA